MRLSRMFFSFGVRATFIGLGPGIFILLMENAYKVIGSYFVKNPGELYKDLMKCGVGCLVGFDKHRFT
jgi:hypothetical protein